MVKGVGVDMVEVARIERALEHLGIGGRFRRRVYTEGEVEYCEGRKRKYENYAARFAAKEAVMKALGVGWGSKTGWLDIEVCSSGAGDPQIILHNKASSYAGKLGIRSFSLSISHTERYAIAYLIAEGND